MIRKVLIICSCILLLTSCSKKTSYERWEFNNSGLTVNGSKGVKGVDIEADICPIKWKGHDTIIAVVDSDVHADMVSGIISTKTDVDYLSFFKDAPIYRIGVDVNQFNINQLVEDLVVAEETGIKVVNMSFTMDYFSQELYNFIKESKMLFVCSVGNEHENRISFPAAFELENIISVVGINSWGYCSKFSNYSDNADIAAPGENVMCVNNEMSYSYQSGTSFAAPFITATCAYVIMCKGTNAYDTKEIVLSTCQKVDSLDGYVCDGRLLSVNNIIDFCEQSNGSP